MDLETCRHCKFYSNDDHEVDGVTYTLTYGACRRFPPRRIDDNNSGYPIVEDDSWCGEFRKRGSK